MKMAVRAMLGALATLALASPSFAASVAPTSYPFTLKGGGNVVQGSNIWACGWTLQGQTTSSSGGSISGGVGDTNPNCGQLSVGSTTWSVTSATAGLDRSAVASRRRTALVVRRCSGHRRIWS